MQGVLQFGSTGGLTTVNMMMQALVWSSQNQQIETFAKLAGCVSKPVHGAVWPDYGFDEWILLCGIYPRAAYDGVLTFVPSDPQSRLLPLDIEYTMWANSASEIQFFGWKDGACFEPDALAPAQVVVRPDCKVLLISGPRTRQQGGGERLGHEITAQLASWNGADAR